MPIPPDLFDRLCAARDSLRDTAAPVTAIARQAHISPYHFIRQFRALFGETPHQYRIRSRMVQAQALLTEQQLSVTETSLAVGHESLGTFSGQFLRHVGESPSAHKARGPFPGCLGLMTQIRNFEQAPGPPESVKSKE